MEGSDRKPVCKQKPRRKKENQEIENEGDENNYFRWNVDMERVLADILREERRLGNKGDGGWKTTAYNSAASILSTQFDIHVTADNIRNRVKSWKKFYAVVSDILSQSGFNWDATKKMISVDEDHAWQDYVKSHSGAKSFHWKVIPNWDDIVDLCGKDRATGEGAETGVEAFEIMTPPHIETNHIDLDGDTQGLEDIEIINDISPTSANGQKTQSKRKPTNFVDVPHTKKKLTTPKDMIADSLAKMASSFQDYICADTKKLDPTEVYDEVNAIPDLSEEEQIKACAWLIENDKQFLMLKTLPVEKKKNMVLLFTSRGA
ncbi:uncharacterized protein [Malus domestica]|uniref:uncharacterized protein isoform X2 n=1 Tax=Malus domestica TaxID=3750 RepID=UPI000498D432